jgi:lipopolysaccharide/colanic/teichoic acid biosynthesis glycosyltransferase
LPSSTRSATEQSASHLPSINWYASTRRVADVVLTIVGLIVLAPILGVIALAIRLDSPGPILFRQERYGLGGRPFTMYKFRTMIVDADDAIHREAVDRFFRARSLADVGDTTFKLRRDPRVTGVGRFLRLTSLDELPQLFNVLNGTMSLVGPRPPVAYELAYYRPHHWGRLAVRPGITGPWQVFGRNRVSFDEMVALDLEYIARRSLLYDLKLLFLTFGAIVSREGAG